MLAALSMHPLVSFLARQLLADLVAAAGSRDVAALQLSVLHKLLGASAAAAAVPGAGWEVQHSAEAVSDLLATVLQVSQGHRVSCKLLSCQNSNLFLALMRFCFGRKAAAAVCLPSAAAYMQFTSWLPCCSVHDLV